LNMDDATAIVLVALIGIGGTLLAPLISNWYETQRKKKERDAKKKSLREGLYEELARVVTPLYAFAVELDQDQQHLDPKSKEEHAKTMLLAFETFNPMVENLKSGLYSLAKKDPELAVLLSELSESGVLNSIYEIAHVIPRLEKLDETMRWSSIRSQVISIHYRLVMAIKKGRLDRELLIASCMTPSEAGLLEDFLDIPLPPTLDEDSELYKRMRELKKERLKYKLAQ
jgi:hypothetical protein